MKIWRGFTLGFWSVLLIVSTMFAILYYSVQNSVLDVSTAKRQLSSSGLYEIARDNAIGKVVESYLTEHYPNNRLIDEVMVNEILAEVLPRPVLSERIDPAVESLYRWLDSKEPELVFSIPLGDLKEQFYRSLEIRLARKIESFQSCGDYRYPPGDALFVDLCRPVYVTSEEATTVAMGIIRSNDFPLGESYTQESLPFLQQPKLKQTPTYLNYLWVINLVVLAIASFVALFVIITRRLLGLGMVGLSIAIASLATLIFALFVGSIPPNPSGNGSELAQVLINAFKKPFVTEMVQISGLTFIASTLIAIAAFVVRWLRGRQQKPKKK